MTHLSSRIRVCANIHEESGAVVAVLASLRNAFALRNLSQEPGRFFLSLLLCVAAFAAFMWVVRRPKSELPATWAQSMLGALAVFALFLLVYAIIRGFGPAAQAGFGVGARIMQALFLAVVALSFAV